MDHLQDSLDGSEELNEKLREKWSNLTVVLLESFERSAVRTTRLWRMILENVETEALPWEVGSKRIVLAELFSALGHEYLMVDVMVKTGVREIINTLQGYLGRRKLN